MRDLAGIAEINGPRAAELQAERAQTIKDATERSADYRSTQFVHGTRVEMRQAVNGEGRKVQDALADVLIPRKKLAVVVDQPAIMDRIQDGIDKRDAFFAFWLRKNAEAEIAGLPELGYKSAREAFSGGPTPEGALSFLDKKWSEVRAVPSEAIHDRSAYHGQFRTVSEIDGIEWHTVLNMNELPISYMTVEAALKAAESVRVECARLAQKRQERVS